MDFDKLKSEKKAVRVSSTTKQYDQPSIKESRELKNKQLIFNRIKDIIVDKLAVEEYEVTLDASITNDLGADSLDVVELIMDCEKEFGVSIPDDKTERIRTVGDVVNFIQLYQ